MQRIGKISGSKSRQVESDPEKERMRLELRRSFREGKIHRKVQKHIGEMVATGVQPIHLWGHLQETALAETGRVLGTLEEVFETGSNHVFVVRREGRELLIPGLRQVVVSVDLQSRTMTVRLIPGMVDDENANADAV